jgi:hypothetical protein
MFHTFDRGDIYAHQERTTSSFSTVQMAWLWRCEARIIEQKQTKNNGGELHSRFTAKKNVKQIDFGIYSLF